MNPAITNIGFASAEIFVAVMACVVLIVDLFLDDQRRAGSYYLSLLTVAGAAAITLASGTTVEGTLLFSGTYVADRVGDVLKLFTYFSVGAVFVFSRDYLQQRGLFRGEYYVLGLFGMLGTMVMISAHNFITVYLGLELLSLSLYALVAIDRDSRQASEAAMKYFVLGAIASGTLLYGISILYGVTGSLDLGELNARLGDAAGEGVISRLPVLLGLAFVLVGLAFKLGAVPFHMWLPDVYHGAPTATTLYIGSASKIAAFALLMRVLVEGMGDLYGSWREMLVVLSVLSIGLGNVVAIAQTNIKRMLAYSTISHVGFILMGFLVGGTEGSRAAMFYTLSYVIMAVGSFGMIILLSRRGFEADQLDDFKGLNARSPWYAGMMLILMFGLAGIPPFLGFFAKFNVLLAALNAGYMWLAVVGLVFSVIGAFYYLRIVKLMYFDAAEDHEPIVASTGIRLVLSANGLAVLALGLYPAALISLCAQVLR